MILYFSGTGNSRHVARRLAEAMDDEVLDVSVYTREDGGAGLHSDKPYVLVVPVYASYIPIPVERWIERSTFEGDRRLYLVMTCGFTFSSAGVNWRLSKVLREKNIEYMGMRKVLMPENYITRFCAPPEGLARKIIARADRILPRIAFRIESGLPLNRRRFRSVLLATNRKFVASLTDKPYYVTDACVGCGQCERVCPLSNIRIADGKPAWQGNCTQCMACIATCPTQAIEYSRRTQKKRRYYLEE